jgi:putative transposase
MKRPTTFRFTLCPTPAEEQALWRHVGAARFAFNQALELHFRFARGFFRRHAIGNLQACRRCRD